MAVVEVRTAPRGGWWCRRCGGWYHKPGEGAIWCPHTNSDHEYVWRPTVIEVDGRPDMMSSTEIFAGRLDEIGPEKRAELRRLGFRV